MHKYFHYIFTVFVRNFWKIPSKKSFSLPTIDLIFYKKLLMMFTIGISTWPIVHLRSCNSLCIIYTLSTYVHSWLISTEKVKITYLVCWILRTNKRNNLKLFTCKRVPKEVKPTASIENIVVYTGVYMVASMQ